MRRSNIAVLVCGALLVSSLFALAAKQPKNKSAATPTPLMPPMPPGMTAQVTTVSAPAPTPVQAAAPAAPVPTPASAPAPAPAAAPAPDPNGPLTAIVFDSDVKEYRAKAGEQTAHFVFYLTNTSPDEVTINS